MALRRHQLASGNAAERPDSTLGGKALAFDSRRGRLVLFGGGNGAGVAQGETWEWDGADWLKRSPAASPAARGWPAMAYDSARGKVVLFGGKDGSNVLLSDSWEYDGTTWAQRTTATSPAARGKSAMAYDSARGRAVLFGGSTGNYSSGGSGNTFFDDTWEYDGTNWTQLSPPLAPSKRSDAGLVFDSVRGRAVLFGGYDGSGYLQDSWEYDGTSWTQRAPATSPEGRKTGGFAYDSLRGRTVLFGGNVASSRSDTWDWDGTAWKQWQEPALPQGSTFGGLVWDSGRNVAVLAGDGFGADLTNTWEYDGLAWTRKTPAAPPPARGGFALGFDAARGETILFGGSTNYSNATASRNDTWAWNGSQWTLKSPPASPSARILDGAQMAFDSVRGRLVLFGGYIGNNTAIGDTWEWDGTTWSQRTSATAPRARWKCALAYDPKRLRTVLFGGVADYSQTPLRDTWEWDGTAWAQLAPSSSPPEGSQSAMAWDSAREQVELVYGGGGLWETGTWEWNGTSWTKRAPVRAVPDWRGIRGAYDPRRGRLITVGGGGTGGSAFTCELPDLDSGQSPGSGPANRPPVGLPGTDRTVAPGAAVTLSGAGSDPDSDALTYSWEQTGGPAVTLTGQGPATASFTPTLIGVYVFSLTVSDGKGGASVSSLAVTVTSSPSGGSAAWSLRQRDPPPSRYGPGMAYDSYRKKTVLFGGNESLPLADTWEWNGTSWDKTSPTSSPPARFAPSMVYDSARRVMVLFGGWFTGPTPPRGNAQDTWEYDGATWTQKSSATVPPARANFTMVYDAFNRKTIMFSGGNVGDNYARAETWAWDGASWKVVADAASSPPARNGQCGAYDPVRRRVVIFGGSAYSLKNDTWEWDGTRWTCANNCTLTPAGPVPPARAEHHVVYSEADAATLVFGGAGGCPNTPLGTCDSFWKWDGVNWTEIQAPVRPGARKWGGIAYDSARRRVVLFGGSGLGGNDTWEWDGRSWAQRYPTPRVGPVMAYDTERGRVVMFGGNDVLFGRVAETWEWDGAGWAQLYPATSPAPDQGGTGYDMTMTYDRGRKRTVLVQGGWPAVTWEWDGAVWTRRASLSRGWSADGLVYDQARGVNFQWICGQAYDWNGVVWRQAPAPGPECNGESRAYDSRRSRTVFYGAYPNTTWEFDGSAWFRADAGPPGGPLPLSPGKRSGFGLAYDSGRGRTVMFGGSRDGAPLSDVWEWDGVGWQAGAAPTGPTSRINAGFVYDERRGRCLLFGGTSDTSTNGIKSGETWEYAGNTDCAGTAARIQTNATAAGGPRAVQLDGAASTGSGLSYAWSLATAPAGAAPLASVAPVIQYAARVRGSYVFQLAISGGGGCRSSASATLQVTNAPPVARVVPQLSAILPNAGVTTQTTSSVLMDASASGDANGDPIAYRWTLVSAPAASTVPQRYSSLPASGPTLRIPFDTGALAAGRLKDAGVYVFRVTVTDDLGDTGTADVQVTALDPASLVPRADAGPPQRLVATVEGRNPLQLTDDIPDVTAAAGQHNRFVRLDARGSADVDRQPRPLTYRWSVAGAPAGSLVTALDGAATALPSFAPDMAGGYQFQLVVSNGTLESAPARTRVDVALRDAPAAVAVSPPVALPIVRDSSYLDRAASAADPPLLFRPADLVLLDGRASFVPDGKSWIRSYDWRQTAGPEVSLTVRETGSVASFVTATAGQYDFALTVTDGRGIVSPAAPIGLSVAALGRRPPALSLVASADTTPGTAPDLGETPPDGASPALRVTLSDSSKPAIRLGASSPDVANGRLVAPNFRVGWRQLDGPAVLLFSVDAGSLRPGEISAAQFSPVTGRVHVFEAGLQELEPGSRQPAGPPTLRQVQVAVDTPLQSVPVARARVGSVVVAKVETGAVQIVTLDGRGSFDATPDPGGLLYRWVQLAGPPVQLSTPFSAMTTFMTPDLDDAAAMRLVFSLVVSDREGIQSPRANLSVDVTPRTTMDARLPLGPGLNLIGLPAIPSSAVEYRLSELAALAGGVSIARLDAATGRFVVYQPALRTGDLAVWGDEGYLLLRGKLPAVDQAITAGRRWPRERLTRRIRRGLNLIALPRGVPAGAMASSLATLTGAGFVARVESTSTSGAWRVFVPGVAGSDFALQDGRGYLLNAAADTDVVLPSRAPR